MKRWVDGIYLPLPGVGLPHFIGSGNSNGLPNFLLFDFQSNYQSCILGNIVRIGPYGTVTTFPGGGCS